MNTLKTHYNVKRILILLAIFLIAGTSQIIQAQQSNIKLTIEVIDASSGTAPDGAIQIEVQSSGSNFTYMLYDKEPWNGGKKLESDKKEGAIYSFTGLRSANYYVCVQNKDEVTKCTTVSIKPKK